MFFLLGSPAHNHYCNTISSDRANKHLLICHVMPAYSMTPKSQLHICFVAHRMIQCDYYHSAHYSPNDPSFSIPSGILSGNPPHRHSFLWLGLTRLRLHTLLFLTCIKQILSCSPRKAGRKRGGRQWSTKVQDFQVHIERILCNLFSCG